LNDETIACGLCACCLCRFRLWLRGRVFSAGSPGPVVDLFDKIAPARSIAVWLTGYYNGTQHKTQIDLTKMDQDIDQVEDYCRLHLDTTVIEATKAALGVGK
jgi:hypothetical protein